jgi:hypothetical protein
MATAAERLHDQAVIHRIGLNRYSNALVRKMMALLNRIEVNAVQKLADAGVEGAGPRRLNQLLDAIREIQAQGWAQLKPELMTNLDGLAANEMDFAMKSVAFAAAAVDVELGGGAPALAQVVGAVRARPFQGRLLREWLNGEEEGTKKRVREVIRQGFVEGQTTDQIVRTLRGTKANQFKDGVLERSRRGLEAMVHTAVTHTSTVAHQAVFEQHADVVTGVIWTSTLDARTTLICISRSEKVFPIDKGPRPPAHIRCRSTMRPQVRAIEGVAPMKVQSYPEWLARQPAAVQDDILGSARGALYRSGGVKVEGFVDHAGKTLTLDQLRKRDDAAFRQAGLDHPIKPPPGTPKDEIVRFLADKPAQRALLTRLMGSGASGIELHEMVVEGAIERNAWKAEVNDLLAIRHYTGRAYKAINQRMREEGGLLEDRQFTALAGRGIETLPQHEGSTWRAPATRADVADRMWERSIVGEDFDMGNHLISTSSSRAFAVDWGSAGRLVLKIRNPKGASVDEVSLNRGEGEVLLPAGMRYRVVRKSEENLPGQSGALRNVRLVELEIIEP